MTLRMVSRLHLRPSTGWIINCEGLSTHVSKKALNQCPVGIVSPSHVVKDLLDLDDAVGVAPDGHSGITLPQLMQRGQ